jgi:Domain of unknown function (DUF4326)
MQPRRVQLSRQRGWRMPPDTVKVDRATRWGNPFRIGEHGDAAQCVAMFHRWLKYGSPQRDDLDSARARILRELPQLRGKHLACWCRPGAPCHAEVLLELANRATED